MNVVPAPSVLVTSTVPWCMSTIERTIASPRPLPLPRASFASELPRIFERFYRGSRANEARGSGSGLGLAIVRSIVDMHHGSIAVDSRLGTGSRFTVILPRDPRAAEAEPITAAAVDSPASLDTTAERPKVADSSPSGASGLNSEASG